MKKKNIIIIATVAITSAFIIKQTWPKKNIPTEFEFTDIRLDTIRNSVTATGTIEPVTKVEVGTQVSGIISKIYVDIIV